MIDGMGNRKEPHLLTEPDPEYVKRNRQYWDDMAK